jgi:hypothetical protein
MGELVPLFPEGEPVGERPDRDFLSLDVASMIEPFPTTCGGVMHIFDVVPGRCQCGTKFWNLDGTLEPTQVEGTFGIHVAS